MSTTAITVTDNITLITLLNVPSDIRFFPEVFDKIAKRDINVDMISVTPPQGDQTNLSFTVNDEDLGKVLDFTAALHEKRNEIKPIVSSGNSKITVQDEGMRNTPGFASRVFAAAAQANADIRIITTSATQISLLVTEAAFASTYDTLEQALNG